MRWLATLLAGALLLPFAAAQQHEPGAAEPATHEEHAVAEHGEAGEGHEEALGASQIFKGLFKHLEPHAVAALWFGGQPGFACVKPYASDASGAPAELDAHHHPVAFHSRGELQEHYAAQFGGGFGLLIYNINTVQWIAGGLLVLLAFMAARSARRHGADVPRGKPFHLLESMVLYVRDDMVYAVMGKEHGRPFVPLFLTQFFFILFMNLFGLVPLQIFGGLSWGATATANLAVTAGMALTSFVAIHAAGIKHHGFFHHWKNLVPHGLPWFVIPIMIVVELVSMFVKPAALTIRLFANMTAGHLGLLGMFGLIYLFQLVGLPFLGMAIFIICLEVFACLVQAYIFTYLSIVFVGASVHPEH
ncbi:MAG TPA: F0F1 ATP synthase subunit A [Planctomycetota bacterium]|nr:F0F1 ATP synthase subunit A [Planctomycetota bacterium]